MNYEEFRERDARLVVLKQLATEVDGRLNDAVLTQVLELFGYRRSRDWVRTQLRKLEELGAVRIAQSGSVLVASLTMTGLDHVERRSVIEGVARPSPGE